MGGLAPAQYAMQIRQKPDRLTTDPKRSNNDDGGAIISAPILDNGSKMGAESLPASIMTCGTRNIVFKRQVDDSA